MRKNEKCINMEKQGNRFSLIYKEHGIPVCDSRQFRKRLSAFYSNNISTEYQDNMSIAKLLEEEIGIKVPKNFRGFYNVGKVFEVNELQDVLDSITLVHQYLSRYLRKTASSWKNFIGRALREENMSYRIDQECGVHYYVDEEFEHNRVSTLLVLEDSRFASVRSAFEDAYRHFDGNPQDTKASVRSMFESLEILVKKMVKTSNLNKGIVQNELKNKCLNLYSTDRITQQVISGLMKSFADWVDILHIYRHGQAAEEPIAPDEQITIHILSTGSSYLRWLVEMEMRLDDENKVQTKINQ